MRRIAIAVAAAALALSPVAFQGLIAGVPAAHADLGWCDTCIFAGVSTPLPPPPHHHR